MFWHSFAHLINLFKIYFWLKNMSAFFLLHQGPLMNYGCKICWPPLSPLDSIESKQPLQSRLLNTPIFIPFWDGPLHPSKCREKLILICFKALQLSLIPVLGSWHLFLQTSYFSSLTKTLEWSIVLWLVNHSKSLNGQWLVSQSLILSPSKKVCPKEDSIINQRGSVN